MKQLLEQYASAVIAAMLALVLFLVIGRNVYGEGQGISQVLGEVLQYSIGEKSIIENNVLEEFINKGILDIEVQNVYVPANEETLLSDCFCVSDTKGNVQNVYLKQAWNEAWEEVDVGVSADRRCICISHTGVYWLQIFVLDGNAKEHSWIVKLLVNER